MGKRRKNSKKQMITDLSTNDEKVMTSGGDKMPIKDNPLSKKVKPLSDIVKIHSENEKLANDLDVIGNIMIL